MKISANISMDEYQDLTVETAIYPCACQSVAPAITYCVVALCGEAGEVANAWKKYLRGGEANLLGAERKIEEELGDVLWYVARLADELGLSLGNIARANILKLQDRATKGEIATHK